ncbi:MAG TPA: hypothetical protein VMA32_05635 [Streptosporangiaceae bacterium]|nr:hypothetical protein [Streptosporangiaceae bacterium]
MLAAYVLPAAVVWAMLGLLFGVLPIATAAAVAAAVYGAGYGVVEASGMARPAAPGRRWQVPQDLLLGGSGRRRVLLWGAILGPGLLTRNPYASFGMLVVLAATAGGFPAGVVVAALIGAAHASGRALAVLRDSARPQDEPFALLLRSLRWRVLDGMALLAVAGAAFVTAGYRLR